MSVPGSAFDTGTHPYGPPLHDDQASATAAWYRPAHTLGGRSVAVPPGVPTPLSTQNFKRKFVSIRNLATADVLYIGDSNQVSIGGTPGDSHAGWPLYPGEGFTFDQREYDGPVWGVIPSSALAPIDVRVVDPTTDQ